jgi:hypothetical protein
MIRFALLAALPLAACAASPHPGASAAKCQADRIGSMIGQVLTPAFQSKARSRAHARTVRVIGPGMTVTMDYRVDRLNIHIDDKNRVTRVDCG